MDILLAVLWPQDHQHGFLPALARLCRLFRKNQVRQGLRNAGSKTEAMMVMQPFSSRDVITPSDRPLLGRNELYPPSHASRG
ncbi:hypothetical protein AOX55_00006545 (plasmid) [Sinorhizobium fredii CCBAU 25509]|nr:hypothetical protein AOX55_00006545 [Sinorhizobium fredii CCBAU 25509]